MARYIDADIVNQEIDKLQTELGSNNDTIWNKNKKIYKGLCYARGIIGDTPTAEVVEKSECDKWYHEYHSIKDQLEREREYLRNEQKLSDKYFLELKDALLVCELTRDRVRELEAKEGELAREILSEIREAYEKYGGAYGMLQKINELEQRFGVIDCTKCRYFVGCESCRTGQVCGEFKRIEN